MWIKLLLSAAIIAFCIFLGYFAAGKYRARKKFYIQFYDFNERYLNELAYARRPLPVFLKECAYVGDFEKAVNGFSEQFAVKKINYLTEDERNQLSGYFKMLGKGDSSSQSAFFSAQKNYLEEKKGGSESEAAKRGELYLKLGLLAGLAFVILIV